MLPKTFFSKVIPKERWVEVHLSFGMILNMELVTTILKLCTVSRINAISYQIKNDLEK